MRIEIIAATVKCRITRIANGHVSVFHLCLIRGFLRPAAFD